VRYLLTGGAGFIGSQVAKMLCRQGHSLIVLDAFNPDTCTAELPRRRLALFDADYRVCDLTQPIFVTPALKQVGAVIHLAGASTPRKSVENPRLCFRSELQMVLNVLEFARCANIPRVVIGSSYAVYGDSKLLPWREDTPLGVPLSPYAVCKQMAETMAQSYNRNFGLDICLLRLSSVYGPYGNPHGVVWRFAQKVARGGVMPVYGDGKQQRDFLYVKDAAKGVCKALDVGPGCHAINLSGAKPHTVLHVASVLNRYRSDEKPDLRNMGTVVGEVAVSWGSTQKAWELLQWKPLVPLKAGLARTIQWHYEQQDWVQNVPTGV